MNVIRALVSQLRETQALACGGGGGGERLSLDQNHNIPEISNFWDITIQNFVCVICNHYSHNMNTINSYIMSLYMICDITTLSSW